MEVNFLAILVAAIFSMVLELFGMVHYLVRSGWK